MLWIKVKRCQKKKYCNKVQTHTWKIAFVFICTISGPRCIIEAQTGNDFHAASAVALRASCPVFLPSNSGWTIWVGSPGSGRFPTEVSESNLESTTLDMKWMQQHPRPCVYCARTWDVPAWLRLLPVVALVVLFLFDFYCFGEASRVCNQISILCRLFGGQHSTHLSERRPCIYTHTSCLRLNELRYNRLCSWMVHVAESFSTFCSVKSVPWVPSLSVTAHVRRLKNRLDRTQVCTALLNTGCVRLSFTSPFEMRAEPISQD